MSNAAIMYIVLVITMLYFRVFYMLGLMSNVLFPTGAWKPFTIKQRWTLVNIMYENHTRMSRDGKDVI